MADETEPNFEGALARIERIVADLERGAPALSAALVKYEDGVKLLRQCYQLLEEAEHSVAILTGTDDQGNPLTVPFDATATLTREHGVSPAPAGLEPSPKTPGRISSSPSRSIPMDDHSEASDPPF